MRILFYAVIAAALIALIRMILVPNQREGKKRIPGFRFRAKLGREVWVQTYDTDSLEEAQALQARLQEEEIECFLYEQGRKDVHGNTLKGFGVAVPRTSVALAQKIIARRIA